MESRQPQPDSNSRYSSSFAPLPQERLADGSLRSVVDLNRQNSLPAISIASGKRAAVYVGIGVLPTVIIASGTVAMIQISGAPSWLRHPHFAEDNDEQYSFHPPQTTARYVKFYSETTSNEKRGRNRTGLMYDALLSIVLSPSFLTTCSKETAACRCYEGASRRRKGVV